MNKKQLFNMRAVMAFFMMLCSVWGWGQVNMTTTGSYAQDFNTLKTNGTASWTNNSTLANWYAANYNASYIVDNGGSNVGGLKSYGTGTSSERALGSTGSGSAAPAYGVVLRNNSGQTITDIKVTYTGEQWRNGGNTAAQPLSFYYAKSTTEIISVTAGSTGYTSVPSLTFMSKVNTGTAAALDGNASANRTIFSNEAIPGLSLASGEYIILKWDDINDSGNDHGLAIDDVNISWTVPPTCTAADYLFDQEVVAKTTNDPTFTNEFISDNQSPTVYSSSNSSVATVDQSTGLVTIVGAGSTTISVTQIADGTYCAVNASYTLNVTSSSPQLAISGVPLNHGSSCAGVPNTAVKYTITNSGAAPAAGINIASTDPQFVVSNLSSSTIAAGGTATFDVVFTPSSSGDKTSTLTVTSTTSGSNTATLALTGKGNPTVAGAVTSSAETNVESKAVHLNGTVNSLGTCPDTQEKGFVWGANANPTISDNSTAVSGIATGAYNYHLTGLTANTTYHYRAYIKDADNNYIYGGDRQFTTLAVADHLAFVNVPAGGSVGNNLASFTVEARRPDNSVDTFYTGNVILSKSSGTGTLSGTLSQAFVNGVATFNDIQFSSVGNYSLHADQGSFTQITSAPIAIAAGPPPFTFVENFDYSNGELNGQGGWAFTASNATPVINVVDGSITYPGYLSSGIGKEVALTGSGQDVNKLFTSQDSGFIYASFLVNVSAAKTGDYFFNLGPNPISTFYRGRVFVKSATGGIQFGVSNAAGTGQYDTTVYNLNTTYLVVLKYAINSTDADAAKIYINPTLNAPEPTTGWTASNDSSASAIGAVALRQGATASAPSLLLDGIRVATKWVDIVGTPSTTWTGTEWSNNNVGPDATMPVIIDGDYLGQAFESKSLTVNSGKTLTVNTSVKTGNVTNDGHIIVADNASFIQTAGATYGGSGTFAVNRTSVSPVNKYAFWSSPIIDQNMYNIFGTPKPTYVMTYNTATNFYDVVADPAPAVAGKGYSIKMPSNSAAAAFAGTPNNGPINIALSTAGDTYNLVGNPYPSNLNLSTFLSANAANIGYTLWFWDNTGGTVTTQNGTTAQNFGYATFNAGGSGTWVNAPSGSATPAGNFAKTGQGFIVEAVGTSLTFNNSMRDTNAGVNFNKGQAGNPGEGKFWLTLTTSYNAKVTQAVTYQAGASDDFDNYDSRAMGLGADAFYSFAGTEKVIIQGKAAFQTDDVVTLGNRHFESGTFTIALTQKEGLFADGQAVYLKDKLTGTQTNLQNGAYTFTSDAGDFGDRFEITYKQGILGTDNSIKTSVSVFRSGDDFVIESPSRIFSVQIYEASGRLISSKAPKSNREVVTGLGRGVFILQIKNGSGTVSKKIVK